MTAKDTPNAFGWKIGTRVATRRGKVGTIVALGVDTVDVSFGRATYTMRNGSLVLESVYRSMGKGYAPQGRF